VRTLLSDCQAAPFCTAQPNCTSIGRSQFTLDFIRGFHFLVWECGTLWVSSLIYPCRCPSSDLLPSPLLVRLLVLSISYSSFTLKAHNNYFWATRTAVADNEDLSSRRDTSLIVCV
jgi:hypothetical protein